MILATHRHTRATIAGVLLLLVAGCGGGGGGGAGLTQAVGVGLADTLVLDLDTGLVLGKRSVQALLTDASYRSRYVVFVAMPAGTSATGSTAGSWTQPAEVSGSTTAAKTFISAFEITQDQWRRLVGTTPWLDVRPTSLAGIAYDGQAPAYGISLDAASSGLASASARLPGTFSLPSAALWERACRGGTTTMFSWGDQRDATTAASYAVVDNTSGGVRGPARVGARLPNAYGLYDTHGNLWELTADGEVRGGSWRDGLPMARSANRIVLDSTTPHALVGVRLVYRPDGS